MWKHWFKFIKPEKKVLDLRAEKMTSFQEALKEILKHEGGYVNDPTDMGGETNYGITLKTARDWGYTGSMRDIPMSTVEAIYKKNYWDRNRLDDVAARSYEIAFEIFDSGVNTGTKRAGTWFQATLNMMNRGGRSWPEIGVDGAVGDKTILSFLGAPSKDFGTFVKILKALRARHYLNIVEAKPSQEKYIRGWINRVL